jgi:hypothetical protein
MKGPALLFLCACSAATPLEVVSPQANAVVSDPSTWGITGRDAASYTWSVDAAASLNGNATMRLESRETGLARIVSGQKLWAAAGSHADAASFVGKRVRFSADVRTESAPDGAWLWLRIDAQAGAPNATRALCNMQGTADLRLKGTNPFTKLSCVLDVSADAQRFYFGFGLTGAGRAWVGPSTLEVVGEDVPVDPNAKTPSLEPATWAITGRDATSYAWSVDATASLNGKPTMRLEPREDALGGGNGLWAATGGSTDAAHYRGKRVRFSADVRTENASGGAWVWLRVDGPRVTHANLTSRALCNMQGPVDSRLKAEAVNEFGTPDVMTLLKQQLVVVG